MPRMSMALVVLAAVGFGCAVPSTMILTDPPNANINVEGQNLGPAPATYTFNFRQQRSYLVTASKPGYFDTTRTITRNTDIRDNRMTVRLMQDASYHATSSDTEVTNRWISIPVPRLSRDEMWLTVINVVNERYVPQVMDPASGYYMGVPLTQEFQHPTRRGMTVRTQFFGTLEAGPQLTYKVKIDSRLAYKDDPNTWMPFNRILHEDLQLIEQLRARLGGESQR
jgi:hypothetical protein